MSKKRKRNFKINKVSTDFSNYYMYIKGVEKSGKTTLFRDLVIQLYKDPTRGLLIGTGSEEGYRALDMIQAEQTETWDEFVDLVDYLVEEKGQDHNIEIVGIDTIDELIKMGIEEVKQISFITTGKKCKSINDALGGYGKGAEKLAEIVDEQLHRLKKSGIGLVVIGHTKLKTIKEKGTEEEYQQLASNLQTNYDSIVSHKADVIATINVEKQIEDGKLVGTKNFINFRSDGFIDCGARFRNIVDRVELSAENFIVAIENAIRDSMSVPLDDEEFEKAKKEEVKVNQKKAKEYIEEVKSIDVEKNKELVDGIKDKFVGATADQKADVKRVMEEYGFASFGQPEEIQTKALETIFKLLG